jgi:hypothetical protein
MRRQPARAGNAAPNKLTRTRMGMSQQRMRCNMNVSPFPLFGTGGDGPSAQAYYKKIVPVALQHCAKGGSNLLILKALAVQSGSRP